LHLSLFDVVFDWFPGSSTNNLHFIRTSISVKPSILYLWADFSLVEKSLENWNFKINPKINLQDKYNEFC